MQLEGTGRWRPSVGGQRAQVLVLILLVAFVLSGCAWLQQAGMVERVKQAAAINKGILLAAKDGMVEAAWEIDARWTTERMTDAEHERALEQWKKVNGIVAAAWSAHEAFVSGVGFLEATQAGDTGAMLAARNQLLADLATAGGGLLGRLGINLGGWL